MSDEQHVDLQPAPCHSRTRLANAVPDAGGRRRPGRRVYVAASLLDLLRNPTGVKDGAAFPRLHSDPGLADDPSREHVTLLRVEDQEPLRFDANNANLTAPVGILNGVLLAIPIWIIIGLLVTYLWR